MPNSLHAKFEVANGPTAPAPTMVQFTCDGASLSGLGLELASNAYRISLLKKKCSAGMYCVCVCVVEVCTCVYIVEVCTCVCVVEVCTCVCVVLLCIHRAISV